MRTQEQILQDMAANHNAYFDHLSDHTASVGGVRGGLGEYSRRSQG